MHTVFIAIAVIPRNVIGRRSENVIESKAPLLENGLFAGIAGLHEFERCLPVCLRCRRGLDADFRLQKPFSRGPCTAQGLDASTNILLRRFLIISALERGVVMTAPRVKSHWEVNVSRGLGNKMGEAGCHHCGANDLESITERT